MTVEDLEEQILLLEYMQEFTFDNNCVIAIEENKKIIKTIDEIKMKINLTQSKNGQLV